mgnify:CR=1 FL=1
MSQWDKLIDKILTLDMNMRFDELRKVLERYGYTDNSPGNGSSHHTFLRSHHHSKE